MHPGSGKKGVKRLADFQAALFGAQRPKAPAPRQARNAADIDPDSVNET